MATRRALIDGGLEDRQIEKVIGRADTDPLDPKQPRSPRNRRVSIVLLRGEKKEGAQFDRLPNFLDKTGPAPVDATAGETLEPAPPPAPAEGK